MSNTPQSPPVSCGHSELQLLRVQHAKTIQHLRTVEAEAARLRRELEVERSRPRCHCVCACSADRRGGHGKAGST
jgi:hypothetical protein